MRNVRDNMVMQDYDGENVLDDMGQLVPASVVVLHNNMIAALRKAYPGWEDYWHIVIDTRGGIVQVRNLKLSGDMGFVLHITKIDPEMKRIREKAGELFERFNVARTRGMSIKKAMADVKHDRHGKLTYED